MIFKKRNLKNSYLFVRWVAFAAAMGGFLQSLVTCVIAGALFHIVTEFYLTPFQEGHVASIILLGALLGAVSCGYIADRFGRKIPLLISAFLYLISACLAYSITSFTQLLLLRFFTGIAVGITSILVPLYLAEIAPSSKRGAFVATFQLAITLGTLGAYVINASYTGVGNWRAMFFVVSIPAAIQFFALFFSPESPKWLFNKGQAAKALKVLKSLHKSDTHKPESSISMEHKDGSFFNPALRKILIIGIVLCVLQQFCGINAIVYFAPKIFCEAGFSMENGTTIPMLVIGIMNVLSTLLSIFLVDRLGRRKLLLISAIGVIFSLLIFLFAFVTKMQILDLFSIFAIILYIGSYSIGFGPITWVLISEMYPTSVRAKIMSLMLFLSWISNYLVVLSFPYFMAHFGTVATFGFYTIVAIFSFFFFLRYIPETKGKTLEELETLLYPKYRNR